MSTSGKAAAAGYQFVAFTNRYSLRVVSEAGLKPGTMVLEVNPEDEKAIKRIFAGNFVEKALEKMSEGLIVNSLFQSAFQGIVISGLIAGSCPSECFPTPPKRRHMLANSNLQLAKANLEGLQALGGGGRGGGVRGGSGRGGGGTAQDSGGVEQSGADEVDSFPDIPSFMDIMG